MRTSLVAAKASGLNGYDSAPPSCGASGGGALLMACAVAQAQHHPMANNLTLLTTNNKNCGAGRSIKPEAS